MEEDNLIPSRVPVTTPTRYISFQAALNLRVPGEITGDWHEDLDLFTDPDSPHTLPVVGEGCWIDSTKSLGSKGVREMSDLFVAKDVIPAGCGEVWVANHYRAITDYALMDVTDCRCARSARFAPVYNINKWLDTKEQIEHLVEEYLTHLGNQLPARERELHDEWLPTLVWP